MKRAISMIWAEGLLDRIAARRLAESLDIRVEGPVQDAGGIDKFWSMIQKYNQAAVYCGLVFALADHDQLSCVGPKLARKVKQPHPNLLLRLSVAELEAWLLADSARLSAHLAVAPSLFPDAPDLEPNPKQTLVNLARRSRKPSITAGMVPKPGHSNDRGPEYTSIMASFILKRWRPRIAAAKSPSLARAIAALEAACS